MLCFFLPHFFDLFTSQKIFLHPLRDPLRVMYMTFDPPFLPRIILTFQSRLFSHTSSLLLPLNPLQDPDLCATDRGLVFMIFPSIFYSVLKKVVSEPVLFPSSSIRLSLRTLNSFEDCLLFTSSPLSTTLKLLSHDLLSALWTYLWLFEIGSFPKSPPHNNRVPRRGLVPYSQGLFRQTRGCAQMPLSCFAALLSSKVNAPNRPRVLPA